MATVRHSFLYRWKLLGGHVHVSVFCGPDNQHRAKAGDLVFDEAEFEDFRDALAHAPNTEWEEQVH